FASYEKASVHKQAGAKRVVITAPAKDEDGPDAKTVLMGVNEDELKTCSMSSNGSCTTNSASPLMQILSEKLGIKKAFLNTTHGYTATQALIDGPTKGHDYRRGRAAAVNIVPSTSGAAIAVARAIPVLKNKFDAVAMRVPTVTGSLSGITFVSERPTSAEEINKILTEAAAEPRWQKVFAVTNDQLVSTDIIGQSHASIADLSLTKVVDGDLCAVYAWYDNEFGYTNSLVEHVSKIASLI
ncbi:MAG TPA: type I glyceraldehyde-3-phosphate dehydrogenase, partial [Candidatus Paceibacterota bacterium]|nr:type I glyceraldehyde-3-phosphate dehydrogenase [Candidatus Paceibacterota bacterium]